MRQEIVISLNEQLIANVRIDQYSELLTRHIHTCRLAISPVLDAYSANSILRSLRPRCSLDMTVPIGTFNNDDVSL
jgi:hypothetical protein